MGRIKSTLIKRTGAKLILESKFTPDFEINKKILGATMPSKRIKNKVAGYITKKVKRAPVLA
ncbi:30S ribosomal protein S17e [Candidatus Pacearchaeota archaeon]|nr:30S ribosomal protein S17e [Candidatus Pacearchaeota archaeon]